MATAPTRSGTRGLAAPAVVIALVFALLHAALLVYEFPAATIFGGRPLGAPDYLTHFHQTHTLSAARAAYGVSWIYDPQLLAGYPTGLVFDVDNKAHGLFAHALHLAGLPLATGFNLFALLSAAAAPLSLWAASRLLGFSARAQVATFALGTLVWHLDSTVHFLWYGGMISFATASHLAAPTFAAFHRALVHGHGPRPRAPRAWWVAAALLPLCLLTHAWAFAILAVPMIALYLWRGPTLPRGGHARVWGLVLLTLAVNAYWLVPALPYLGEIATSTRYGQATPAFALADFLELVIDPDHTGHTEQRTLFRFVALIAALAWIARARARRDLRWFGAAVALAWLFGLAYVGSLVPGLDVTEPYRFVVPGALFACVFAGPLLARLCTRAAWRQAAPIRGPLVIVGLLLIPRVVEPLLYFVPELAAALHLRARGDTTLVRGDVLTWRIQPPIPAFDAIAEAVRGLPHEGRVLVEDWPLAEHLAATTDRPILGGFPERRLASQAANLMRAPGGRDPASLADYVARYHVRYVVDELPIDPAFGKNRTLFMPVRLVDRRYFIHEVRRPSSYFAAGGGTLARVEPGVIEVADATPEPGTRGLTLRFHHMDALRCTPGCRLEPRPVTGRPDAAPFLRVEGTPALPRRFTIHQVGVDP